MSKKVSQKDGQKKRNRTKVIRSIRSKKTGAYTYKEEIIDRQDLDSTLAS